MRVFFVRHGHTFGPDQLGGEKIVMCGSGENLPLVKRGRDIARRLAQKLISDDIMPDVIYANTLLRTWEHAVILREEFYQKTNQEVPILLDEHLIELDYGAWANLGTDGNTAETNEVISQFGMKAWKAWQEERVIPNHAPHNWQVTREDILQRVKDFADFLVRQHNENETIIAMGSQGTLTFLNSLLPGGMDAAIKADRYKVKPGHYIRFEYAHGAWACDEWNEAV